MTRARDGVTKRWWRCGLRQLRDLTDPAELESQKRTSQDEVAALAARALGWELGVFGNCDDGVVRAVLVGKVGDVDAGAGRRLHAIGHQVAREDQRAVACKDAQRTASVSQMQDRGTAQLWDAHANNWSILM